MTDQRATPGAAGERGRGEGVSDLTLDSLSVVVANHVVVPAAIIAMVSALLFYLLELRSVLLTGGEALKWISFCFAVATVLIARYGKVSGDRGTSPIYTLVLAVATVLALLSRSVGPGAALANTAIVAVVWWFATSVTNKLSLEETATANGDPRGEENPTRAVAGLALLGLAAFALGEPLLMAGPPEAGPRALLAMIGFLLATGLVMAASSAVGTLRRAQEADAPIGSGFLPARVATAAALLLIVLTAALATPGLRYQGSDRIALEDLDANAEAAFNREETGRPSDEAPSSRFGRGTRRGSPTRSEGATETTRQISSAGSLLAGLRRLGTLLGLVLVAAVVAVAIYLAARHRQLLALAAAAMMEGLRDFWSRLSDRFAARGESSAQQPSIDPFADLDALRRLPPRAAVVGAYGRLLALFDNLDHPRPPGSTPYELLRSLPRGLQHLVDPIRRLTALYVKAAYSDADFEPDDGTVAVEELVRLRRSLATRSPRRPAVSAD